MAERFISVPGFNRNTRTICMRSAATMSNGSGFTLVIARSNVGEAKSSEAANTVAAADPVAP